MNNEKRLTISVAALVLLCACLCITSFALGYAVYQVQDNSFQTGSIKIALMESDPSISFGNYEFEPGMTVDKTFTIKNNGTGEAYCKLYFSDVEGELGDVLEVTVLDDQGVPLLTGKMPDLDKNTAPALDQTLAPGESRDLTVRVHFPEQEGNRSQAKTLTFKLSATAVQTKNNPNKEF